MRVHSAGVPRRESKWTRIRADRWAIYLFSESKGFEEGKLEAVAVRKAGQEGSKREEEWGRLLEADLPLGSETKAARRAAAGMGIVKKKERGKFVVAVPLICGERILGVIEGVREDSSSHAFKKSDVALLDSLSLAIASALANAVRIAEAERLSQTDDLTKLHNARYLRQFHPAATIFRRMNAIWVASGRFFGQTSWHARSDMQPKTPSSSPITS